MSIELTTEELAAQAKEQARLAHITSLAEQSEGLEDTAPVTLTTLADIANLPAPEKAVKVEESKLALTELDVEIETALRLKRKAENEADETIKVCEGYEGKNAKYMAHTYVCLRNSGFASSEADKVTRRMVTVMRSHLALFDSAFEAGLSKKDGQVKIGEKTSGTVESSCFTEIVHANGHMSAATKHHIGLGTTKWTYSLALVDSIKLWLRNFGNRQ